jgi:hypothetical protein
MQNRYVGDIGDFGKYALLNALSGNELRLGVHWYLNANEEANADGNFTDYPRLRNCDPDLYDALQRIVRSGCRSVHAVERSKLLPPNTIFFSFPCPSREHESWNAQASEALAEADLIFMDPDNGLKWRTTTRKPTDWAKYVSKEELAMYIRSGKSLILYQHQTRDKGGLAVTIPEAFAVLRSLGCETTPWALVFRRLQVRVYFIIPSAVLIETLCRRTSEFLGTRWGREGHFELYSPIASQQ